MQLEDALISVIERYSKPGGLGVKAWSIVWSLLLLMFITTQPQFTPFSEVTLLEDMSNLVREVKLEKSKSPIRPQSEQSIVRTEGPKGGRDDRPLFLERFNW